MKQASKITQIPKRVEITKHYIRVLSDKEDFFIPLSQVAGVVYNSEKDKLEIHNVNKEMTVTFRRCPNLKDYFEQIILYISKFVGQSEFKVSGEVTGGAFQTKE